MADSGTSIDLELRFRSEYPAAFQKLRQPLENVKYEARRVKKDYEAAATYYIKGTQAQEILRYDAHKRIMTYPDFNVNTYTPSYEFVAGKDLASSEWFLQALKPHKRQSDINCWFRVNRFAAAPFYIWNRTVDDVLSDESLRISDVQSKDEAGVEVVTVTFLVDLWSEYEPAKVKERLDSGRFSLVPTLDWAIKRVELGNTVFVDGTAQAKMTYTSEIECDRWVSGFVGPRSVHLLGVNQTGNNTSTMLDSAEFTSAELGVVEDSQFKLSAFGLPDSLLEAQGREKLHWYQNKVLWCVVTVGVACWAGVYLLRRRRT